MSIYITVSRRGFDICNEDFNGMGVYTDKWKPVTTMDLTKINLP